MWYLDRDPVEVCGIAGDWVYQGPKCDPCGASVWHERWRNFTGQHFWLLVSTDGRDEAVVRDDIRRREEQDRRLDQLNFDLDEPPSGGTR